MRMHQHSTQRFENVVATAWSRRRLGQEPLTGENLYDGFERSSGRNQASGELGGCGAFPRSIAGLFPTAQQAVLTIVAHEVRAKGDCRQHIQEIADRAQVSRSTVQNAIGQARVLGLITVHARRLSPVKNLANVVGIVSTEWRCWLKLDAGTVSRCGSSARNSRPQIQVFKHRMNGSAGAESGSGIQTQPLKRPARQNSGPKWQSG